MLIRSERLPAPTVPAPAPRATPAASFLPLAGLACIADAALAQVLAHDLPRPVAPPLQLGYANAAPIAWRPDGKLLAEPTAHNGYTLRGTGTGQVVKSAEAVEVPPEALAPPGSPGTWDTPRWSPDGKWLLLPTLALVDTSALGV